MAATPPLERTTSSDDKNNTTEHLERGSSHPLPTPTTTQPVLFTTTPSSPGPTVLVATPYAPQMTPPGALSPLTAATTTTAIPLQATGGGYEVISPHVGPTATPVRFLSSDFTPISPPMAPLPSSPPLYVQPSPSSSLTIQQLQQFIRRQYSSSQSTNLTAPPIASSPSYNTPKSFDNVPASPPSYPDFSPPPSEMFLTFSPPGSPLAGIPLSPEGMHVLDPSSSMMAAADPTKLRALSFSPRSVAAFPPRGASPYLITPAGGMSQQQSVYDGRQNLGEPEDIHRATLNGASQNLSRKVSMLVDRLSQGVLRAKDNTQLVRALQIVEAAVSHIDAAPEADSAGLLVDSRRAQSPLVLSLLAHPDEFKNPSSFLKVYGDPACSSFKVTRPLPRKGQDGNWECPWCSNVNYPRRFRCNKEGCGAERDREGDRIVSEYARQVYTNYITSQKRKGGFTNPFSMFDLSPSTAATSPSPLVPPPPVNPHLEGPLPFLPSFPPAATPIVTTTHPSPSPHDATPAAAGESPTSRVFPTFERQPVDFAVA